MCLQLSVSLFCYLPNSIQSFSNVFRFRQVYRGLFWKLESLPQSEHLLLCHVLDHRWNVPRIFDGKRGGRVRMFKRVEKLNVIRDKRIRLFSEVETLAL